MVAALTVGLTAPVAMAVPEPTAGVSSVSVTLGKKVGTHSIAYAIGTKHHRLDQNWGDFDITATLVARVLASRPGSPLKQLAQPYADGVTCFLPTDAAYRRLATRLTGKRVMTERAVYSAVVRVGLKAVRGGRLDLVKVESFVSQQCLRTSGIPVALPTRPGTTTYFMSGLVAGVTKKRVTLDRSGVMTFRDESPATPDALVRRVPFRSLVSTQRVYALSQVPGSHGVSLAAAGATCAQGGVCAVGDTGPGGGVVYYVAPAPQSWGQYLEVAPNGWNGALVDCKNGCGTGKDTTKTSDAGQAGAGAGRGYAWCNTNATYANFGTSSATGYNTGTAIGTGEQNTALMVSTCQGSSPATYAGNLASAYRGGGMFDWALPSQGELSALYSYGNRNAIGGFAATLYWTSSYTGAGCSATQNSNACSPTANTVNFNTGSTSDDLSPSNMKNVRPVRVF